MSKANFRGQIIDALIPYAKEDDRVVLLVGDMGFGVIDRFRSQFPNRVINCGMMEQGMVGIAAGMAMAGLVPVVYCIVNFLVFRAIEQIRNDVVHQNLNVKFVGTGANDYFKFLGASHCCGDQDKAIMDLIGMPVFDPYADPDKEFAGLVRSWMTSKTTGYIRV